MKTVLLVALGGGLGATCRYLLSGVMLRLTGPGFPWGTLTANIAGSFAMGVLVAWLVARSGGDPAMRAFIGVGLLGGFTTFSAFSLETMRMIESKALGQAAAYIGASVMVCLIAVFAGLWIGRKVWV